MEAGPVLQVLSSFTANLIEAPLQRGFAGAGVAYGVGFTAPTQTRDYMLAPGADTEHILGTVVLLRVEDWLRDAGATASGDAWARQELQARLRDFVSELTILSYRGKPVWFLACPSTGWISLQGKWTSLCRTYTNLLVARVQNIRQVTTLNWPTALSEDRFTDPTADKLENIPFTQDGFDKLGEFVAAQIAHTFAPSNANPSQTATGGPELAAYLAALNVQVKLSPVDASGRVHVDRIIRTAASFSLTGEKPDIPDTAIDALLASEHCVLVSVSDRFSDHGPSGLVVYRSVEDALVVESLSLSCTVLGKQVEYAVLSALAQIAAGRNLSRLLFEYRPSGRNQPMLSFLQSVADRESDTRYVLSPNIAAARIGALAVNPGAWSVTHSEIPAAQEG
jgi:hypothetical protein